MSKPAIAFLGLGIMGEGMARRLLDAGFPLTVYNRNPAKASDLVSAGARLAASPHDAAQGARIIVGMLADDNASREVWLGPDGAMRGAPTGAILVESSTLSVGWVRQWAEAAQGLGLGALDAPVTGSKVQAAAGELTFVVGGQAAALEIARPALEVMSKAVIHLGPSGSGATFKLINNFLCGVQVASLAEAVSLIERSDLDRDRALELLIAGAGGSPLVKTVSARMAASDFAPNFLLRLMAKDLSYALDEAATHALDLTSARTALATFDRAIAAYGDEDIAAVVRPLRDQAAAAG